MEGNDSKLIKLAKMIVELGIDGVPPVLESSIDTAHRFMYRYGDECWYDLNCKDSVVKTLIKRRCMENFLTGAVTSLGGILTLPFNITGSLAASWVIQSNLSASIAYVYDHDLYDEHIRTALLLSVLGDSASKVLKDIGVKVTEKALYRIISKIPGKLLIEINKRVGFRLVTKAGEKGVINLARGIPIVGALVGGTVDGLLCRQVGKTAQWIFRPSD